MKRITNPETQWDVLGEVYNAVDRLREIENDALFRAAMDSRKESGLLNE